MKILHVNASDAHGGAAIAAMRHCEAMRAAGIEAEFLCVVPHSGKSFAHGIDAMKSLTRFTQRVYNKLNFLKARKSFPYASWSEASFGFDISSHPLVNRADEIWIHWINGGMLSIKSIGSLLKTGKTITWYMHDMWPLTGGCHYSLGCSGFEAECGKCPLLFNREGSNNPDDISRDQMLQKLDKWSGYKNLRILAPSRWLASQAEQSALFGNGRNKIGVLPNPIDTSIFAPLSKANARSQLSLPKDKPLILFGAHNINDSYKGMHYLIDALPLLRESGAECVVFGQSSQAINLDSLPIKVHSVGSVNSADVLRQIYSAADVFVTPSIADNYPNVLVEAMACGTPCVGFNIGGIPEIIQDGVSGVLASQTSPEALADAILQALPQSDKLGMNARNQIIQNNSYENYRRYSLL